MSKLITHIIQNNIKLNRSMCPYKEPFDCTGQLPDSEAAYDFIKEHKPASDYGIKKDDRKELEKAVFKFDKKIEKYAKDYAKYFKSKDKKNMDKTLSECWQNLGYSKLDLTNYCIAKDMI